MYDADGNAVKLPRKKTKICEHVQKKKLYKDEGIEMKTEDKHWVDNKYQRQLSLDHKT